MAEQKVATTIQAPGFAGLNSQDSQVQLETGFASNAMNCVIDKFGRIGARKGWTKVNSTTNADLGTNPIQFLFEMQSASGNVVLSAGNNKLFTGTTSLTTKTVRNAANNADLSYTITANHWQGAALPYGEGRDAEPHVYLAQAGHPTLVFHELPVSGGSDPHSHDSGTFGFQRLGDIGTLPAGYSALEFTPNCSLAAYGRIWLANIVNDRQTVYFSRLLDGSDFTGGDSGFLSLGEVFPNNDEIVALAAHNGFLIIFGRNNIAIYGNPIDVTQLTLAEFIPNVGCIARDSVQNTGTDVIFLSDGGLRSLQRVIQEKSLPFRDMSKNVRDDFMNKVYGVTNKETIKGIYYEREAFYLIALPTVKEVYCFDTRGALQDGSARVTIWNRMEPTAFVVTNAKDLYIGQKGFIGDYSGYLDDTETYRLEYFTTYFDLGQPTVQKILKKVNWVIVGGSQQPVVTKWGFDYSEAYRSQTSTLPPAIVDEYGIAEYNIAEYATGTTISNFSKQLGGTGAVIQIGLETEVNQAPLSIQKIDVFCKVGKVV
jgi:hypothetical protein